MKCFLKCAGFFVAGTLVFSAGVTVLTCAFVLLAMLSNVIAEAFGGGPFTAAIINFLAICSIPVGIVVFQERNNICKD